MDYVDCQGGQWQIQSSIQDLIILGSRALVKTVRSNLLYYIDSINTFAHQLSYQTIILKW